MKKITQFVMLTSAGLGAACLIGRSEEHTSELQSLTNLVCRLLLEKNCSLGYTLFPSLHFVASPVGKLGKVKRKTRQTSLSLLRLSNRWQLLEGSFFFLKNRAPPKFYPFPPQAPFRI